MRNKEVWGLVDYHVNEGPNGWWYVAETCHTCTVPGDFSPHDNGTIGEYEKKQDAINGAKDRATNCIQTGYSRSASVFVEGDEVLFIAQGRKWVK